MMSLFSNIGIGINLFALLINIGYGEVLNAIINLISIGVFYAIKKLITI